MDKTIPAGAAMLLDFIGGIEAPRGYGTIYGNKQHKLAKPLTEMTLDEVIGAQRGWSENNGSSAAGRYQFMRATLQGLVKEMGLPGAQKLDSNLQDRLGYHLLKRRGYEAFAAGKIDRVEFGKRIAQEWASMPVLAPTKGGSRNVVRGQSYYAGDGLNKSLVKPEQVETVLAFVRQAAPAKPAPIAPAPETAPKVETPPVAPQIEPGAVVHVEPDGTIKPGGSGPYVERNPFLRLLFWLFDLITKRKS